MFADIKITARIRLHLVLWLCMIGLNTAVRVHKQRISKLFTAKRFVKSIFLSVHLPLSFASLPFPVFAFENAVKIVDMPKTRGPEPKNLGLQSDTGSLLTCTKPSPNCFSTSEDEGTIDLGYKDIHAISLWKYTAGNDPDKAYELIGETLKSYVPGQSNVDGGGFKIIGTDAKLRYYYVQFESLKRGFIDDLEIAVNQDCSIQVRSSSRLGYLDYTVNAKRLNFIATMLNQNGFEASLITEKTHPEYFEENGSR
jgi:uncharacterized protein (DUF1499 family)